MPKLTPELKAQTLDPKFATKWDATIQEAFADYLLQDYEAAIRTIVGLYGMTFEELQEESDSVASTEWAFDMETAEYFFLQEGFDTDTGKFLE